MQHSTPVAHPLRRPTTPRRRQGTSIAAWQPPPTPARCCTMHARASKREAQQEGHVTKSSCWWCSRPAMGLCSRPWVKPVRGESFGAKQCPGSGEGGGRARGFKPVGWLIEFCNPTPGRMTDWVSSHTGGKKEATTRDDVSNWSMPEAAVGAADAGTIRHWQLQSAMNAAHMRVVHWHGAGRGVAGQPPSAARCTPAASCSAGWMHSQPACRPASPSGAAGQPCMCRVAGITCWPSCASCPRQGGRCRQA